MAILSRVYGYLTMTKGFTLIELLIVVAIIAILAAIAVPNFLEAQTRAKVSRQLSNLRTVATAIETYTVDNNTVPLTTYNASPVERPGSGNWALQERWKMWPGGPGLAGGLTTPIAYISSVAALEDIFRLPLNLPSQIASQVMYVPSNFYEPGRYGHMVSSPCLYEGQSARYGTWQLRSAGPDMYYRNVYPDKHDYGAGPLGDNRASYDPTNGTVSGGDIIRSQRNPTESHALK